MIAVLIIVAVALLWATAHLVWEYRRGDFDEPMSDGWSPRTEARKMAQYDAIEEANERRNNGE